MSGFDCFFDGFSLITKRGLRRYFIVPTLINAIVLIALVVFSWTRFTSWVDGIMGYFPEWASFLYWLIWLIAFIIVLFLVLYSFTLIANLIAAPFNALLSIKVEQVLTGKAPVSQVSPWLILPRALWREVSKLLYVLPRLLVLIIITIIPLINTVSPILWVLFGAWMMSIQYTDYGADNNDVTFADLKERLGRRRFQAVMFGLPAYLLLTVPFVNLILMPVGVAGGTRFWVEHLKNS